MCYSVAQGQSTSLTATITDSTGQAWANGTYSITFVPVPGFPPNYQWNGAPFVPQKYTGSLNSSGTFTVTRPDNTTITPAGTQWQFVICPNATTPCSTILTPVTGSSEDLSSFFSGRVSIPNITAAVMPRAYSSSEIATPPPQQGGQFFSVTDNVPYFWTGSSWISLGGSVSSVGLALPSIFSVSGSPVTTSGTLTGTFNTQTANYVLAGPASGSAAVPTFRALVSADIPPINLASSTNGGVTGLLPNGNLANDSITLGTTNVLLGGTIASASGFNSATSTALAATPTQCTAGDYSTGIAANGNANCTALPASFQTQTMIITSGICTTGTTSYAQCSFSETWPTAFTTTPAVTCMGASTMTGTITQVWATSVTTSGYTVNLQNGTSNGAAASTFAQVDCIGVGS